ncbi:MAG: GRP family sugar transporter [Candidatus Limnocylindrales bacterium]
MDPLVFGLVGAAAVLHVSWNVLVKTSGDPRRASTLGMAVGAAVIVPAAIVLWLASDRPGIRADAAALAVVSGLLETVYFVLLSAAYRRGNLSVVYPIARGTAPLLAVLVGWGVLGEQIRPLGWLGVALLLAGILAIQRPWRVLRLKAARAPNRTADLAVVFALLTGLAIVAYSAVDRVGVRLVSPWLYAGIMWPVSVGGLLAWAWLARHEPAFPPPGERLRGAVVGLLTLAAYLLVLLAYTLAPLAVVAPLRESAIVLASGWGAFRLAEAGTSREAALRVGAAAVVLAGAAVLAFGA